MSASEGMEERLEQLELIVGAKLFEASLQQLLEVVEGTKMQIDGKEVMR